MAARAASMPRSPPGMGMARTGSRGQLSRAGWHIMSSSQLLDPTPPPVDLEADGARLVRDVAALWCGKYIYHIVRHGANGAGFHYECIFSRPTDDKPVPSIVVRSRFALVVPQNGTALGDPQLVFSFEEGDLRHAWKLQKDTRGRLQICKGQQFLSLRSGFFEEYLDKYILEKEKARSRGVGLATRFEASRLPKPRTPSETQSGCATPVGDDAESSRMPTKRSARSKTWSCGVGAQEDPGEQVDMELHEALKAALKTAGLLSDLLPVPGSLEELLTNVFDAADEEDAGELAHYDVNRLLSATLCGGFGLHDWDIQSCLASSAQESEDGMIECKPFIMSSPELIMELRRRRHAYIDRGLPGVAIEDEAITFCFESEILETTDAIMQLVLHKISEDPYCAKYQEIVPESGRGSTKNSPGGPRSPGRVGGSKRAPSQGRKATKKAAAGEFGAGGEEKILLGIKRYAARECVQALGRISPQEAARMLESLPEDEEGFLVVQELEVKLADMRKQSILNALVETDGASLRKHLVICFRNCGITEDSTMKLWTIKQALLKADQICLSRQQVFLLTCLARSCVDTAGNVDVSEYLALLNVVIPHMFDARIFVKTAEGIIIKAEAAKKAKENAELAALGAKSSNNAEAEQEVAQEVQADQDTVEKALIQAFTYADDLKRNPAALPPETLHAILLSGDTLVASCQLSEHEICGFVAEMNVDIKNEVQYHDHVKRTVQMVFELRRHPFLSSYSAENAFETMKIPSPNAEALEAVFPMWPNGVAPQKREEPTPVPEDKDKRRSSKRRSSKFVGMADFGSMLGGAASRRPSKRTTTFADPDEDARANTKARARLISHSGTGKNLEAVASKETPNGRGYLRRKAMLSETEAAAK